MQLGSFWNGRRVLLTGHTGFKGAWLCLLLHRLGAEVSGYALPPATQPNLFELAHIARHMDSRFGTIADLDALTAAMRDAKPEIVIHMAAQALVRDSYDDPVGTFATNVQGTVNLLEAVRRCEGVRAVVVVTTDKCYQNNGWVWGYRETDALGGYDPYSSSKAAAELITASYRASFFNPAQHARHGVGVASARAGNVIGGGDWAKDRLIPDLVRALSQGAVPLIRSPHAVRPWQHVLEPLSGYLRLAERLVEDGPAVAEGWNFGPAADDAQPVSWIADRLVSLWGEGARWDLDRAPQPHEASYLSLDTAKARQRLDYHPRWNLIRALDAVVAWTKAHQRGADMRAESLGQIETFLAARETASPVPVPVEA